MYKWNDHDALWHIALMEQIKTGLPPNNPLLSGVKLVGYHYLNDIFLVAIHSVSRIPIAVLYLQITPYFLGGLFGATTLWLFIKIFGHSLNSYLGASIAVFGSGLAFFAPFIFPNARVEQSVFWLDQSVHYGINQQLLLSLSLVNVMLIIFRFHLTKKWWLAGILLGLLGGIKVYGWMVLIASVGFIGIVELIQNKNWRWLGVTLIGGTLAGLYFLLVGNKNGFPFLWSPGWFWQKMFESSDHLNWSTWELRRQVFAEHHNYPRLTLLWLQAAVLFFVGNFSVKLLGLTALPLLVKNRNKKENWYWLLFLIIIISFTIPSLFIQKGVVWNTIQFLHYASVPLCILGLWMTQRIIKRKKLRYALQMTVLIISLPTTIQTIFVNSDPAMYISYDPQLVADIQQLREQYLEKELLLSSQLDRTALIPALSRRPVYWADTAVLTILNQEFPDRKIYVQSVEKRASNCTDSQVWIDLENNRLRVRPCPLQ